MNFDEFKTKWTGKPTDFDGIYPNQCMDLMHFYVYECLGITDKSVLARAWAALVYTNFTWETLFEKIPNSATAIPQKGDIIFWEEALNYDATTGHGFGHVAIVDSANINTFKSFDANWPLNSLPHIQDHNYTHVLGWLRFKGTPATTSPDMYKGYDLSNKASMKSAVDVLVRVMAGEFVDKSKYTQDLKGKQDTIDNLNQQINDRNQDIVKLNGEISTLKQQVLDATERVNSLAEQAKKIPELEKVVEQAEQNKQNFAKERDSLNKQIGQLKNTSYTTMPTSKLVQEVTRRILHL